MKRHRFADVKAAAAGKWPGILIAAGLAPEVLSGKHQPCSGCGGKDRFRYVDTNGDGFFVCGRGGDPLAGDGFELLQHAFEMSSAESLRFVAEYLGLEGRELTQADRAQAKRRRVLQALSEELVFLGFALAAELASKPISSEERERMRLAPDRIRGGLEVVSGD